MLECYRQDTKKARLCIDNMYGFIKFTYLYQLNHYFRIFLVLHIEVGRSAVADMKCFSYIIKELLN